MSAGPVHGPRATSSPTLWSRKESDGRQQRFIKTRLEGSLLQGGQCADSRFSRDAPSLQRRHKHKEETKQGRLSTKRIKTNRDDQGAVDRPCSAKDWEILKKRDVLPNQACPPWPLVPLCPACPAALPGVVWVIDLGSAAASAKCQCQGSAPVEASDDTRGAILSFGCHFQTTAGHCFPPPSATALWLVVGRAPVHSCSPSPDLLQHECGEKRSQSFLVR